MTGSLKNATRSLNAAFAESETNYPFPDHLERVIELFVETHQEIDEYDSQKLHEELLVIYTKYVVGNPDKHGPFVATLRRLQPIIRGTRRLEEWWDLVIRPTIDSIGHKRDEVEDARDFLLGVLVYDEEDDTVEEKARVSARFTERLLQAYLARTRMPSYEDITISPENEFLAHELESILVAFGRKNPKQLLKAIDELLVKQSTRLQALSLLSSFVRLQPPHLHLVLQTSLIGHLHTCLLLDQSATVVDLALTVLIMFIPHITTTLVADLPRLFMIYARILCWDQHSTSLSRKASQSDISDSDQGFDADSKQALHIDSSWQVIEPTLESTQTAGPKADYLFTFLYGLFPLNFMSFIRKPRKYLKAKLYPRADDLGLNQTLIRTKTDVHRLQHKLHPSFFLTTAEDELTDNRWLRSDPADLVSECLGLCIAVAASLVDPGPPPSARLPALPKQARSIISRAGNYTKEDERLSTNAPDIRPSSNRTTVSTSFTGTTADAANVIPRRPSQMSLTETILSGKESLPLTSILNGDDRLLDSFDTHPSTPHFDQLRSQVSGPSSPARSVVNLSSLNKVPSLQSFAQTLSRFPAPQSPVYGSESSNTAILRREVMLLKNDLNFERYQKQKYIEQIGNLQRKHMSDVAVETDTQTLMNKNRGLKSRLLRADERYEQLKKEMASSRTQSKRFEEQLTSRLKSYREDEKKWQSEIQTLKHALEMSRVELEDLKTIIVDSERRERESRNQMRMLGTDIDQVSELRQNVNHMESRLQTYEQKDMEFQKTQREHDALLAELQAARLKLSALDHEREQMRHQFEEKIMKLEADARNSSIVGSAHAGALPSSVQQMIDSALAVQQNKYTQLKKNYTQLHQKFMELDLRNQELEIALNNGRESVLSLTRFADDQSLKGINRQDSIGSGSLRGSVSQSRNGVRHDFTPSRGSIEPLTLDTLSPGKRSSHIPGTVISRTASGGLAANTTPLLPLSPPRSAAGPAGGSRDASHPFDKTLANEFSSPLSPVDNLADSLHLGPNNTTAPQLKPALEVRAFGRGGVGNVKKSKDKDKDKDKDPAPKKSGFRLKGIM